MEMVERERKERRGQTIVQQAVLPAAKENPAKLERRYYSELPRKKIHIADPVPSIYPIALVVSHPLLP